MFETLDLLAITFGIVYVCLIVYFSVFKKEW